MTYLKCPKKSILPKAQQSLWPLLCQVPESFVLCGGTAIALYLGHRESIDFDFFSFESIDPDRLLSKLDFLKAAKVIQREQNTLTCLIDFGGPVQVSFFGLPKLGLILEPLVIQENGLKIASLLDLGGMKASVVQKRAEYKDYVDLYSLLIQTKISLSHFLSAAALIYGSSFNPQISLKALSYFEEGNLKRLTQVHKAELLNAVKGVNLGSLPSLIQLEQIWFQNKGLFV